MTRTRTPARTRTRTRTRNRLVGATALAALAGLLTTPASASPEPPAKDYEPTVESLNSHPTPTWFNDDKFGIFIHWGAYSVPAWGPRGSYAEWYWNSSSGCSTSGPG
ncbi:MULTISPECIES: alpha-L-fucosidase [unclassified Streptomyces]|uniref:alpha-L-fucosidase n=1 Tax=unclassified Streptomyces TaxID=2593676 RepID=UPI002DD9E52B|nr:MULTISPECIES: alpha-L-fucosidase [unclassified Streptomyces]WSC36598.1 alpha-L-fucosidase [Streptomyces sp. NBC_01763]WSC44695.1 alpha-L-fucosidase [Streptomyces sp. NBC_01762]WSC56322.1 alpha-L-fucosidase [Streptomyces sp. NBC_01761]WSD24282.1 alpha-L-fucosidase [Streptomyces sp. NBC_01751]